MGLTESIILTKEGDLLWVFLTLKFFHGGEPVGHFFAMLLLDRREELLPITI